MASSFTTNTSIEEPAFNDYINSWQLPVNANWTAIDAVFGNTTSLNVVAVSGTVNLTLTQYRPRIIKISGLLTANIIYSIPSGVGGTWTLYNTTTGAFTVTFASAGGGTSVVLPQGYATQLTCDGTNVASANTAPINAGGSNTQVQYNNGGALGGSANLTFNGSTLTLTGTLTQTGATNQTGNHSITGQLRLDGSSSGFVGLQGASNAGSTVYTLPAADGTNGQALVTNGSAVLSWASSAGGIPSFSAGTTGLTPSSPTSTAIVLGGTLATTNGGTNLTSFTSGGAMYATSTSALTTGTLPVTAGGTGKTTFTSGLVTANGTSALATVTAPSGAVVGTTDTQTLTNKRLPPRIGTVASGSTITPTGDTVDQYNVTALATNATIAAPSGTPTDGQPLILRITDNGTPRTLSWNAVYVVQGVVLPTTTVASTPVYIGVKWNAQASQWDVLAVS